jgi:two-component system, OmpR family, phosphate regulon sensor histidine kinase PhoR
MCDVSKRVHIPHSTHHYAITYSEQKGNLGVRVGIVFSLMLLALLVLIAMTVGLVVMTRPTFAELSVLGRVLIGGGLLFILFAAVLIPLGVLLDRSVSRVQHYIEGVATDEKHGGAYVGPQWLTPITHAFVGAVDQFHQREQDLRAEIRELEIRHRVSEAERRQIEAVLHALRDAVIVTDAFNEIVMVNETAAEILGFKREDVIHQPISQVINDERLCRLIDDARQTANFADCRHIEHEIPQDAEYPQKNQPGVLYDVTLSCVANHKNEVAGVVAILRDLTREREISQMKSDFVSKASHELRTPLSSIRAYVEMLVDGEAEDEQSRQEFYRIIQDETDRLGRLIDNMLNISRIEAGIVQIERERVDMKELIDRAINTLEPHAREKEISLHCKTTNVDLCVEGDPDMLYQVVLNLTSNAVKYTPEGGRVTVAGDTDNLTGSVLISVSDTGLGIPPDSLPRIFDKFYRVENYKRVAKGTGLGLSLCKHIVETVHHGQIGVESQLGMGSKFWFTIPMRYAGAKRAA